MNVLVTGANGFVGSWMVRRLLAGGHAVTGGVGPQGGAELLDPAEQDQVRWLPLDLADPSSIEGLLDRPADAVIHLAGLASVSDSLHDPGLAWEVNAVGTVRLLEAIGSRLASSGGWDPVVLLVSTGEVYGRGTGGHPRSEDAPVAPVSPYAASKAALELAGLEAWRRRGLRVVVARPFPHTGPGQSSRFVVPAFIARLQEARASAAAAVPTGNLDPVRDFLDVRDVVDAYLALVERGEPGQVYNVASGRGIGLRELFARIAELVGCRAVPEPDPSLARAADIPHLVGDAGRLRAATGWSPRFTLDETLRQMIDA